MQKQLLVAALIILFVVVLLRTAWVGDDAYITMRTVDNFVRGYGLRWNVAERVQAYTHPLWMLLITPFYAVTRDAYFTLIGLGLICSTVAFALVIHKGAASWGGTLISGIVLLVSKAFTDYSTSGLENPLSHFLIALFALYYFTDWKDARSLFRLTFLLSLELLNRLDLAPLLLPPFVWRWWQAFRAHTFSKREGLTVLAVGLLPMVAWEAFSVFYYGFPFPNTAYAKLRTGIPRADLIRQGLCYLMDSVRVDPVSLSVVGLGVVAAWARSASFRAVAVGILLSLGYVVSVGGDFMTGRFLTPALFMSVIVLAKIEWSVSTAATLSIIFGVLGMALPKSPIRSDENYQDRHFWSYNGIADERGMFYQQSGLLRYSRETGEMPNDPHMHAGRQARYEAEAASAPLVMVHPDGTIGFFGFEAGPKVHIVDPFALADPLLARMTAEGHVTRRWRIGHFIRSIPPGYLETLRTGRNCLEDPDYAKYYDKLALITRGPLWSWQRFKTIVAMNLGRYDVWLRGKVIFGAHAFAHRTGERKSDPTAQSDSTLIGVRERDEAAYLAFGNYMVLKRGRYKAQFRLRVFSPTEAPVARLDVAGDQGRVILAERVVCGNEFKAPQEWTLFELPFEITKSRMKNVEFRVYFLDQTDLELDNVTLAW